MFGYHNDLMLMFSGVPCVWVMTWSCSPRRDWPCPASSCPEHSTRKKGLMRWRFALHHVMTNKRVAWEGVGRGAVKMEEVNSLKGDKTSSVVRLFLSTVVLMKLISLYCLFSTAHWFRVAYNWSTVGLLGSIEQCYVSLCEARRAHLKMRHSTDVQINKW